MSGNSGDAVSESSWSMGTDTDDELLEEIEERLVLMSVLQAFQRQSRERRFKLHQQRVDWPTHVNGLRHTKEFTKTYRMPYRAFTNLVTILWDDVVVNETQSCISTRGVAQPIFPELVVAIGLRWIAGSEYAALRDWSGISTSSFHCCTNLFMGAVLQSLDPMLGIHWPTTESELRRNAAAFQQKATDHVVFQHVVGAIDGLLIRITQPVAVENPRCYFSGHYECFGLNVQGVCDADLRFIYFGVGGPGATPDINAYRSLSIGQAVTHLREPYHLVGDAAYIPCNQLLTPYTGRAREHVWKDIYNFFLLQMRIRIEMAFGRFVNKWRMFRSPLQTHLKKSVRIIETAFRLHNYVINWQTGQRRDSTRAERRSDDAVNIDETVLDGDNDEDDGDDIAIPALSRRNIAYYESGYDPTAEEEQLGEQYNNIAYTVDRRQEIVVMIQRNQWQRPSRNVERNA